MRGMVFVIALSLVACAAPEEERHADVSPAGRDCFNVSFLTGYESVDRDTIRVRAGPGASYDIDVSRADCNALDWTHRLAVESTPSSWICVGAQAGQGNIIFRDPTTRRRAICNITNVSRAVEPPDGS